MVRERIQGVAHADIGTVLPLDGPQRLAARGGQKGNRATRPEISAGVAPYLCEVNRIRMREEFVEPKEFVDAAYALPLRLERATNRDEGNAALFEPTLIGFRIGPQQLLWAHRSRRCKGRQSESDWLEATNVILHLPPRIAARICAVHRVASTSP